MNDINNDEVRGAPNRAADSSLNTLDTTRDRNLPWTLRTPEKTISVVGQLLGHASSHRENHTHETGTVPHRGWKCSACRWFEVTIIKLHEVDAELHGGVYAVSTEGHSIIPGEIILCRVMFLNSPYEMIEILTARHNGNVFLPAPAARALAQASDIDEKICDAYLNRAVV